MYFCIYCHFCAHGVFSSLQEDSSVATVHSTAMQCDSDFAEVKGNKFFLTYIVFHLNGFMYGLVKVLFSTGPAMQSGSDDQVQDDSAMKGGDDDDAGVGVQVCKLPDTII